MDKKIWGFLRETSELADKAGKDADTGLCRTGLDEYLRVIFPDVDDWIHDKTIDTLPDGIKSRKRPDYRSESLRIIVEFDGLPHYTDPERIKADIESIAFYESIGYKVVRIPYFIQLSNDAVLKLFDKKIDIPLFDEEYPSLGPKGKNTPAYLCMAGVYRMAKEFKLFPKQYEVNRAALLKCNDEYITGIKSLEKIMAEISNGF